MEQHYIKKDLLLYTMLIVLIVAIIIGIYYYDQKTGQFGQFASYFYGVLVRK